MSYKNIKHVLPDELVAIIQEYIDGEYIYIPRKEECKKSWGSNTSSRQEIEKRNRRIYQEYQNGFNTSQLSEKYYLSIKSIQRIVLSEKRNSA